MRIPFIWIASIFFLTMLSFKTDATYSASISEAYEAYSAKNFPLLFSTLQSLSRDGDTHAAYMLGYLYLSGKGVDTDLVSAERNFKKAAKGGSSHAENALGTIYADSNPEKAVGHYLIAAEAGNLFAIENLITLLIKNPQISHLAPRAYAIVKREADAKVTSAITILGTMHENRIGVPNPARNFYHYKAARTLYEKAVSLNDPAAMYHLAGGYVRGDFVTQDLNKAAELLTKSADLGLAEAQFQLGVSFADGRGVRVDRERAIRLVCQAATQGLAQAIGGLAHIGMDLSECKSRSTFSKASNQKNLLTKHNKLADNLSTLLKVAMISYGIYRALDFLDENNQTTSYDFSKTGAMGSRALGQELLRQKSEKNIRGRGVVPQDTNRFPSIGYRGDDWDGYLQPNLNQTECNYYSQGRTVTITKISTHRNCPQRVDIPGFSTARVFDYERFFGGGITVNGRLNPQSTASDRYCIYTTNSNQTIKFPKGNTATCPASI